MQDETITASTFFTDESINAELSELGSLPSYPQTPSWSGNHATLGTPMIHNGLALYHTSYEVPGFYEIGYSLIYILSPGKECEIGGANRTDMAEGATRCVIPLGKS